VQAGYKCVASPYTVKDFVYPPAPYLNLPKIDGLTSAWMDDKRGNSRLGNGPSMMFNPVERAFRTTLFVKTKTYGGVSAPFIIVSDDIQKDELSHKYSFVMNLPWYDANTREVWQFRHDQENVVQDIGHKSTDGMPEMVLKDTRDAADSGPRLLVRVLRANGLKAGGLKYIEEVGIPARTVMGGGLRRGRHVVIETQAISPDFRIFLYVHEKGDPLPTTIWEDAAKTQLAVGIPGGEETKWLFAKDQSSNRTRIMPFGATSSPTNQTGPSSTTRS
jgi:hypothetical protein